MHVSPYFLSSWISENNLYCSVQWNHQYQFASVKLVQLWPAFLIVFLCSGSVVCMFSFELWGALTRGYPGRNNHQQISLSYQQPGQFLFSTVILIAEREPQLLTFNISIPTGGCKVVTCVGVGWPPGKCHCWYICAGYESWSSPETAFQLLNWRDNDWLWGRHSPPLPGTGAHSPPCRARTSTIATSV